MDGENMSTILRIYFNDAGFPYNGGWEFAKREGGYV